VCHNHARALRARGYGNSPQDRRLQYFEGATLKSRRCSDASVFQSATLIIVTVASPLSMSQIAWLLGYEGSNRGPKTKAIAKAAKGGLRVAFLCIVTRRARNCGKALRALNRRLSLARYWPKNGESLI
jgi:hypothetical protein